MTETAENTKTSQPRTNLYKADWVSDKEAAEIIGCKPSDLATLVNAGKLDFKAENGGLLFPRDQVTSLLLVEFAIRPAAPKVATAPRAAEYVYFIGNRKERIVKIGLAEVPAWRLPKLQTACPYELELLAEQPGSRDLEQNLHIRFRGSCIRGEWFKLVPRIERYIDRLIGGAQ